MSAEKHPHEHHLVTASSNVIPFVLVTALFFFWGIPNNLNDVLIKQFEKSFELNRLQAGLVQSAFYMGYFLVAIPAAMFMRRFSYKWGLVLGLVLYGIGSFLMYPAAMVREYSFFLFALFVIATGLSFLETGANPFIATLGDPHESERRLNLAQAFNPFGAISGALIGTLFIFSGIEHSKEQLAAMAPADKELYLATETMRVVQPYMILGLVVLAWAVLLALTKFPKTSEETASDGGGERGSFAELFRHGHFVQGVLAQFLYVGAQVGTWSFFIQYVQDNTGRDEKAAGYFLTGTLVAFLVGRFFGTWAMKYIRPGALMGWFSLVNVVFVAVGVAMPSEFGMWCVFLTSFFMSVMFPTIFALGIKELGPNTKIGGSMIVMAIIGGAALTPIMGLISDRTHSIALAYVVPLACYLYVAYYGFVGSRVKSHGARTAAA
ncbi:MAG: L-fucose:H+ symporter permease [Verrucomicrobiae bacterium]|nr:L-fucose:H+ symporter permease [Verrucomicrobiae bacterium]